MNYRMQRRILLFGFLFIPTILLVLFLIYPTGRMLFYSLTDWDGVLPQYNFIGFRNFVNVFTEPNFWLSLKNNAAYAISGIVVNIIALFFAVVLSSNMRMKNFYKTVIFLPYMLNLTAVAYMFNFMYDYNEGPINLFVKFLGLESIKFFSDQNIAIYSLVFISNWRWLGYVMVIYIAALQSVETEVYESSSIDGANSWKTFWYITFPSIIRIVELQLFLSLSGSLQAFTETMILTKGGPAGSTRTFMYYIIETYTNFNNYGYAAAMSVTLVIIIILIAAIQQLALKKGEKAL